MQRGWQNKIGRTELLGMDCQDRAAKIGLPGQGCQDRTARTELPSRAFQDRTDRIRHDLQHGHENVDIYGSMEM